MQYTILERALGVTSFKDYEYACLDLLALPIHGKKPFKHLINVPQYDVDSLHVRPSMEVEGSE